MNDQLINIKTANLAKVKKFNEYYEYSAEGSYINKTVRPWKNIEDPIEAAVCTQTTLLTWLRRNYSINVLPVITDHPEGYMYTFSIFINTTEHKLPFNENHYKGFYEEAIEIGLQEALKLI